HLTGTIRHPRLKGTRRVRVVSSHVAKEVEAHRHRRQKIAIQTRDVQRLKMLSCPNSLPHGRTDRGRQEVCSYLAVLKRDSAADIAHSDAFSTVRVSPRGQAKALAPRGLLQPRTPLEGSHGRVIRYSVDALPAK